MVDFSYDFDVTPQIAYVRLLISDTDPARYVFKDKEIDAFYRIQGAQWQSAQFFSAPAGRNLPSSPVSYLRVAALALDSMASMKARQSTITQVLDVHLSIDKSVQELRSQADCYREVDDNAGAIAIIEQVCTSWGYEERMYSQIQRQLGGGEGF